MNKIENMSETELLDHLSSLNSEQLRAVCEEDAQREGDTIVMRLEEIVFRQIEDELGHDVRDGEEKADQLLTKAIEVMDIPTLFSFIGTLEEDQD